MRLELDPAGFDQALHADFLLEPVDLGRGDAGHGDPPARTRSQPGLCSTVCSRPISSTTAASSSSGSSSKVSLPRPSSRSNSNSARPADRARSFQKNSSPESRSSRSSLTSGHQRRGRGCSLSLATRAAVASPAAPTLMRPIPAGDLHYPPENLPHFMTVDDLAKSNLQNTMHH